jgi:hypothetical protein
MIAAAPRHRGSGSACRWPLWNVGPQGGVRCGYGRVACRARGNVPAAAAAVT